MTGLLSAPLGLLTIDLRACGVCVCEREKERERDERREGERGRESEGRGFLKRGFRGLFRLLVKSSSQVLLVHLASSG